MTRSTACAAIAALALACGQPSTVPSLPGVRVAIDTTYYDAAGTTPREWLLSARRGAASAGVRVPFLAHTGWSTRWTYTTHGSTYGCEARYPVVVLAISFIMPRLVVDSVVSTEDRVEWLRFMHLLWTHEEGHAQRGVRAAAKLRDSLQRTQTATCALLATSVNAATRKVLAKYASLQTSYDERTLHGARQGAMIIPDRGARLAVDTTFRDTVP